MNERGIISLTALCMMLILSIAIATVRNIAARQADIVKYYRLENELQSAAESYFNEVVANLSQNAKCYEDNPPSLRSFPIKSFDEQANVTIYLRNPNNNEIIIMSLAEIPNYHYDEYSVYKKVVGYMTSEDNEKYEFAGYISTKE